MLRFRILIAEDDNDDFLMIRQAFEDLNIDYILDRVDDGQQVLKRVRSTLHTPEEPNLILLDINMPKINGIQALQELRKMEECRGIPIVMHSTACHADLITKCLENGATGYLAKGTSYRKSLQVVEYIVNFLVNGAEFPVKNELRTKKLLI